MSNFGYEGTASAAAAKPTRMRAWLAVILFVCIVIAYLDRVNLSVLVADPLFLQDMGLVGKPLEVGLLTSFFIFAYGVSNFVLTPFGDKFGPRKATIGALTMWIVSSVIGGLAPVFAVMLLSRVVLGLGEGMHFPMQSKFVKNWFPPLERGRANAAWVTGIMVGPAVSMPFFTTIVQHMGWRESYLVLILIGLIPIALLYFFSADTPRDSKHVNMAELNYIESALADEAQAELKNGAKEVTEVPPLKEIIRTLLSNRNFVLITIYYMCLGAVVWGTMAWLPSYLKVARGFSWAAMGAWSAAPYVAGIVIAIITGYLSDRYKRSAVLCVISMVATSFGLYMGATAADNTMSALWMTWGVGFTGMAISPAWTLVQKFSPANIIGIAAGYVNGLTNVLSAFVPATIGALIALTGNYLAGMLLMVGLGIIAALAATPLMLKKY